jgi:hypothetical protein
MPITPTVKNGNSSDPVSAGTHHAICYGVIDVGTHSSTNPAFSPAREVIFLFELPNERGNYPSKDDPNTKIDQPRGLYARFINVLSNKSRLRKMLVSWRGREFTEAEMAKFDISGVIGANCMATVIHKEGAGKNVGKTYANVDAIMGLPKGMPTRKSENPRSYFSFEDQTVGNVVIPTNIPEWIVNLIKSSFEYKDLMDPKPAQTTGKQIPSNGQAFNTDQPVDEDVPF